MTSVKYYRISDYLRNSNSSVLIAKTHCKSNLPQVDGEKDDVVKEGEKHNNKEADYEGYQPLAMRVAGSSSGNSLIAATIVELLKTALVMQLQYD